MKFKNQNSKMKIQMLVLILIVFAAAYANAEDARQINLRRSPGMERKFLSTAVLEQRKGSITKSISEIKRRVSSANAIYKLLGGYSQTRDLRVKEEALVRVYKQAEERINEANRVYQLDEKGSIRDDVRFDDIIKFGMPIMVPKEPVQIGSRWRKDVVLLSTRGEVPISISYTLEDVGTMLGRDVAVINFMFSGLEDIEGAKKRWAGIGREVWDVENSVPLLRILEIKYGNSFVKDIDFKLSYSESILS